MKLLRLIMILTILWLITPVTILAMVQSQEPRQNDNPFIRVCYDDNSCRAPFTNSEPAATLDHYVEQVLANEWHGNANLDALKVGAIAIRTFSQRSPGCGAYRGEIVESEIPPITARVLDNRSQRYRLGDNPTSPQNPINLLHEQAQGETRGTLLLRSNVNEIACAKYDANTGDPTRACDGEYCRVLADQLTLPEVVDPVSSRVGSRISIGMSQNGSVAWTRGTAPWDYRMIASHYYNDITLINSHSDYRWVWLDVGEDIVFTGYSGEEYYGPICEITSSMKPGNSYSFNLRFKNTGQSDWSRNGSNRVRVGYYWNGNRNDAQFTNLPTDMTPNDPQTVQIDVIAPEAGNHSLIVDLVEGSGNNRRWFSDQSLPTWPILVCPVVVDDENNDDEPGANINYPPTFFTADHWRDLGEKFSFSWQPTNGAVKFDLDYHSRDLVTLIWNDWVTYFSRLPTTSFLQGVPCDGDRRDYEFRLRGHNEDDNSGDWIYTQSQLKIYPFLSTVTRRMTWWVDQDDTDPHTYTGELFVTNDGGGTFEWQASVDVPWLSLSPSSGIPEQNIDLTLVRPSEDVGTYHGTIHLNTSETDPKPCNIQATVPITVHVVGRYKVYLPIVLKETRQATALNTYNSCQIAEQGCFKAEFLGLRNEGDVTAMTFRVTNSCRQDVSYVAIGTNDWTRSMPFDRTSYSSELGQYMVEWTNESGRPGFTSIKFESQFDGYNQGASDLFKIGVEAFDSNNAIEIQVKSGQTIETLNFLLDDPICHITPAPVTITPSPTTLPYLEVIKETATPRPPFYWPTPILTPTVTPTNTTVISVTTTPTMTTTPVVSVTPTSTSTPIASCTISQSCFTFESLGYTTNDDKTTLTFQVTDTCKHDVSYIAIGTNGWKRLEPIDNSQYAGALGRYKVVWTGDTGNPGFTSVKFEPTFSGYSNGATDTFQVVVEDFDITTPIRTEGHAGPFTETFNFSLNEPNCGN